MEIELTKDVMRNVKIASEELGISEKEVVVRAVLLYLRNVKEFEALQEEMKEWEEAGIEDANNFFQKHNL
jgi:hypothetical protein